MAADSTQMVLRQFVDGQLPTGTILAKVLAELPPSDMERLRRKAAEGVLGIELEGLAAAGRFHASSADIREFIENVKAIEVGTRGTLAGYRARGEFETASGKTTIEVKKGCYVATEVYGSPDHPNVAVLRRFRDEVLERSLLGRSLCAGYYRLAPLLLSIRWVSRVFYWPAKWLLHPICGLLRHVQAMPHRRQT